jgi:hypothetical protein
MHEYCYEYDVYRFSEDGVVLTARSYENDNDAHFLGVETQGMAALLTGADLEPLLATAVAYLRGLGKTQIQWSSGSGDGYEELSCRFSQATGETRQALRQPAAYIRTRHTPHPCFK